MKSYNIQIENLCSKCGLGELSGKPKPIMGGYMHRIYDVRTENGRYAIKALNPAVMEGKESYDNLTISERMAGKLADKICVSVANRYNDSYIQELDGQFYLIYDFIDGRIINGSELTSRHAYEIGKATAVIHSTDFSDLNLVNDNVHEDRLFDWSSFLVREDVYEPGFYDLLKENIDKLYYLADKMNKANARLSGNEIICHGDLYPENVLWVKDRPVIIDWESAWFYNPWRDFLETALYWSENPDKTINYERLAAFINGYTSQRPVQNTDWLTLLYGGLISKLAWLETCLKRALGIECADSDEQRLGREQAVSALKELLAYEKQMHEIDRFLKNSINAG